MRKQRKRRVNSPPFPLLPPVQAFHRTIIEDILTIANAKNEIDSGFTEPWRLRTMLDVLIVSPHPDDAELGMGGAIMKFQADGMAVGVLDLTSGEPTPFGSPEIRQRETAEATKVLGLGWRENLGLPNRSLEATLSARAALAGVFRRTRPRWLFAPYWIDAHPDHVACDATDRGRPLLVKTHQDRHAGRAALSRANLLLLLRPPAAGSRSRPSCWTSATYWDKKRAAIECYRSQFIEGRPQLPPTFVDQLRDQAATWGWSIGTRYGEPFASREPVGLRTLKGLV